MCQGRKGLVMAVQKKPANKNLHFLTLALTVLT